MRISCITAACFLWQEQERFYGQYDRLTGFFIGEANKEAIAGELAEEGVGSLRFTFK